MKEKNLRKLFTEQKYVYQIIFPPSDMYLLLAWRHNCERINCLLMFTHFVFHVGHYNCRSCAVELGPSSTVDHMQYRIIWHLFGDALHTKLTTKRQWYFMQTMHINKIKCVV